MKTQVTTTIINETDEARLGYWHQDRQEWIELSIGDDFGEASEILQCSEELLNALVQTMDILVRLVGDDLADIWKRLDGLAQDLDIVTDKLLDK